MTSSSDDDDSSYQKDIGYPSFADDSRDPLNGSPLGLR